MKLKLKATLTALLLLAGAAPVWADNRFSDVPASHSRSPDILLAVENRWFQGYEDGTFRPDKKITDTQAAAVINRAFPAGLPFPAPSGLTRAEMASFLLNAQTASQADATAPPVAPPVAPPPPAPLPPNNPTPPPAGRPAAVPEITKDSPPVRYHRIGWEMSIGEFYVSSSQFRGTYNTYPNGWPKAFCDEGRAVTIYRTAVRWQVRTWGAPHEFLMLEPTAVNTEPHGWFYGRPTGWLTDIEYALYTDGRWEYGDQRIEGSSFFIDTCQPVRAVAVRVYRFPTITDNIAKWSLPTEWWEQTRTATTCRHIPGTTWWRNPPLPGWWAADACRGKI